MKEVNKWLELAENAIVETEIANNSSEIKSVYKGYVSSFGAMVIQNGLPAALAINLKTDDEDKNRRLMIQAISRILKSSGIPEFSDLMVEENGILDKAIEYAGDNDNRRSRILKEHVINAGIALKLMMRTHKFID